MARRDADRRREARHVGATDGAGVGWTGPGTKATIAPTRITAVTTPASEPEDDGEAWRHGAEGTSTKRPRRPGGDGLG